MAYLIDTDILIYSLKGHAGVQTQFRKKDPFPKAISVITFGELLYGAKKSKTVEKSSAVVLRIAELFPIIEITRGIIEIFADLKASLSHKGQSVDDMDLLIGSTALFLNYTLVTNNEKHFSKIPGLALENWSQ
jgi:tRNA(fMet)-specific endonuclease VapC